VPDVIRQGGARLVEVGTTNKTRLTDYRAAIGPDTRVAAQGASEQLPNDWIHGGDETSGSLAGLARAHGLLVVADLATAGLLHEGPGTTEPSLTEALSAGADLVTCSGDKLLEDAGRSDPWQEKPPSIGCATTRYCGPFGLTRCRSQHSKRR